MYKIKQKPEDFKVIEIPNKTFEKEGTYSVWKLTKTNYNTEDAIQTIARTLRIQRKQISYAGTKDKQAITEQHITITKAPKEHIENLHLKDIILEYQGQTKTPISLGDLKSNKFKITIRNLNKEQITKFKKTKNKKQTIPNYFGEQRFQKNNAEIGKLLVKRKFKEATTQLTKDFKYGKKIEEYTKNYKGDSINALRQIPKKILSIYVHAYQSKLWNETAKELLKANPKTPQINIPLIGFGTETNNQTIKQILDNIMKREKITERDFIIREFPEISAEGGNRTLFAEISNIKISNPEKDELNSTKENTTYKLTLTFELGKGSYATTIIKYLMKKNVP